MSRGVSWPIDWSSIRLTGKPARTRLSLTLRRRLISFFRKLLKLKAQMIVNTNINGITSTNEESPFGLVDISKARRIAALQAESIIDLFIIVTLYLKRLVN